MNTILRSALAFCTSAFEPNETDENRHDDGLKCKTDHRPQIDFPLTRSERIGFEKLRFSSKSSSISLNSSEMRQNLMRSLEFIGSNSLLCWRNASSVNNSLALWYNSPLCGCIDDFDEALLPSLPLLSSLLELVLVLSSLLFCPDESWLEADELFRADDVVSRPTTVRLSDGTGRLPILKYWYGFFLQTAHAKNKSESKHNPQNQLFYVRSEYRTEVKLWKTKIEQSDVTHVQNCLTFHWSSQSCCRPIHRIVIHIGLMAVCCSSSCTVCTSTSTTTVIIVVLTLVVIWIGYTSKSNWNF